MQTRQARKMADLLANLFAASVAGSVVVGVMLVFRPVTAETFPAKWQHGIGKMAIGFFLLPVSIFTKKPPSVQPAVEIHPGPSIIPRAPLSNDFVDAIDAFVGTQLTVELVETVFFIWLAGAIVFAGWHFYCYCRFSSCKAALGVHDDIQLMLTPGVSSPMLVGLRRPMILLPVCSTSEIHLNLVLTHELMHLKRKDLWVKMLALIAGTLHWFNPLVHVLRLDVSIWEELSCDEVLACEMPRKERKLYGEAILDTLDLYSGTNAAFRSSFCGREKHIEGRLTRLLNVKQTKKHIAVFAVVATVAIACAATLAAALAAENTPRPSVITASHAGDAIIPADNEVLVADSASGEDGAQADAVAKRTEEVVGMYKNAMSLAAVKGSEPLPYSHVLRGTTSLTEEQKNDLVRALHRELFPGRLENGDTMPGIAFMDGGALAVSFLKADGSSEVVKLHWDQSQAEWVES